MSQSWTKMSHYFQSDKKEALRSSPNSTKAISNAACDARCCRSGDIRNDSPTLCCRDKTITCSRRNTCDVKKHNSGAKIFALSLVAFVSLLNGASAAAADFHFPDIKQEKYAQELIDYHISWPARVTDQGAFLSHELHNKDAYSRAKRSLRVPHPDDDVHFNIPVGPEQEVLVSVRRSRIFLSPSAVVERMSSGGNLSDHRFSTLEHHQDCHVQGEVKGQTGSMVALHVCSGLRGYMQIDGVEYLIEPVKGHKQSAGSGQAHMVYRRSAIPDHLDFLSKSRSRSRRSEPACGVQEKFDKVVKKREMWERRRRSTSGKASSGGRGRHKRSISMERHVETLVVVDPEMVHYYENEEIETYVLTVMNMVAALFHDASIGNAVNIVIVRMLLMQDPDEKLRITHHADKTLKSFCQWQKGINFKADEHPNHHDVAVLLTRRNICSRINEPCSTLGLAQVAGLCQPHRSCSINEDTGLSLAWTVAHELGHNFGMKHDNAHSGCQSDKSVQYVMAPYLTWDNTPSTWSKCSRDAITKFLDRNWGYCLEDPPAHHRFKYPELPAGTMYDADHQCRLLYGEGAERCNGLEALENICTTLWCRVNNKCSTKLQAAAVGTICGTNKWCFSGKCVDIGERPEAIDGEWGQWQEWTDCTRTCGAGVSVSQRRCNHPPPSSGGKYCTGERKRYRICNAEQCDENSPSFRNKQCTDFNKIPYKGSKYEWEPFATPDTPCQLHCKPKGLYFSVLLKDIVTDGTPCQMGSRHMCISGRCRHVGCDWKLESNAREDRCGVCFGDGSTCKTIKQHYNESSQKGYVEATVIPAGARNIRVEEVAEASNFLALRNDQGEYYLNGDWFIQWSGDYELAGTVVHYKRTGNKEKFSALGPIKEPLHIMLLMQAHNPGVEFEYTVPKENFTDTRKPEFTWDFTGWSHCTVSCGKGTQRSAVVCKELEAGLVDEHYCDSDTKPDDLARPCNTHLCPARWWTGPWQHCSVTCGTKGIRRRTVICIRSSGDDEQIALEDAACRGLDKPGEVEPCRHKDVCPGKGTWSVGDWSNCTRLCNGGVQFRKVVCIDGAHCDANRPDTKRSCNDHECLNSDDEENQGITEGNVLSDSNSALPSLSESSMNIGINEPPKPIEDIEHNNEVFGDNSSDNNVDITNNNNKHKHKHRHHKHHQKHDNPGVTDSSKETNSSVSPEELQGKGGNTRFIWQTTDWSECSIQCGKGVRSREVFCIQAVTVGTRVGQDFCDIGTKPSTTDECVQSECLDWQTGDWGTCSASCGEATQQRQVLCTNPGRCDDRQRPTTSRRCEDLPACIAWVYGSWSQCSKTCGGGSQQRLVQCVNLTSQQLAHGCPNTGKPLMKQNCNTDDCPKVNAALGQACESNEMSWNVCKMLKKVNLCHKEYVKAKCCRTCTDHSRPKPAKSRMNR